MGRIGGERSNFAAGSCRLLEQLIERHEDLRVRSPEHAVPEVVYAGSVVDVSAMGEGVQHPYVMDSKGQVIADTLEHVFHPIVFREDLDAKEWRVSEDLFRGTPAEENADIGNAKSVLLDLNALFRIDPNT